MPKIINTKDNYGARGRTRTGTLVRARDFKSLVSTNFTTRAKRLAKVCFRSLLNYFGGWSRNRTGVHGVAVRCMTTLPSSHSSDAILPKIFKITSKIFKNFQKFAKSMSLLIKKYQLQDTNLTTYPKYLKKISLFWR